MTATAAEKLGAVVRALLAARLRAAPPREVELLSEIATDYLAEVRGGPTLEPDQRLVFVVGAQSGAVEPLDGAGATSAAQGAGSPSAARSVSARGMTGNDMEGGNG